MTPNPSSAFEVPNRDRADHRRIGAILRRNGAFFLALPLVFAALGATFGLGTSERHEATVQVALHQESGNRFLTDATRFDSDTIVDAHVAMIRSDATAVEVLRLFRFGEVSLDGDVNSGRPLTVNWLRAHTVAATAQRGGLIEITAWAPKASSAKALANGLAEAHVNLRREAMRASLSALAERFEEESEATREELERLGDTPSEANEEAMRANALALENLVSDTGLARIDAGLAQGGVSILERATTDGAAVGADPVRTAAVTAFIGLFLAVILAAARERLWGTLASPTEVEVLSGMAVLGEVPKADDDGLLSSVEDLGGPEHRVVKGVIDWVMARHQAGEPETPMFRRLAIVGVGPRGVASSFAYNTAACLAQRGPVTLVVSADAEQFGMAGPTWMELLDETGSSMAASPLQAPAMDLLATDAGPLTLGDWEDLEVIAGGWNDPYIERPNHRRGTDALLNALSGPSGQLVMEVDNLRTSPAGTLAACTADAVLVVVTLDRSRPDELQATLELLESYHAPVAGVVVQHRSRANALHWSTLVHQPVTKRPESDTETLLASTLGGTATGAVAATAPIA